MSLALITGNPAKTPSWTFVESPVWSIPFRLPALPKPVAIIARCHKVIARAPSEGHQHRFIHLMEKAVIGSLISLWLLAGWVLVGGVRSLLF